MSDVDPLIRREMQWMALGVLENRDLAPIIIARFVVKESAVQLFLVLPFYLLVLSVSDYLKDSNHCQ